jgi:thiol-disulfide isomerase/thioredoxin
MNLGPLVPLLLVLPMLSGCGGTGSSGPANRSLADSNKKDDAERPARLLTGGSPLQIRSTEELKGKPMPDFEMTDIQGNKVTRDGLKGKVVLLDFWATWCPPCRKISPVMQVLHNKHAGDGLVVIGVDTYENQSRMDLRPQAARAYARDHQYTYTMTYGNDPISLELEIRALPTMLLLDRKGIIREVFRGAAEDMEALRTKLDEAIRPLLEAK